MICIGYSAPVIRKSPSTLVACRSVLAIFVGFILSAICSLAPGAQRPFDFEASWGFAPIPGATVTYATAFNTISTQARSLGDGSCNPYSANLGVTAVGLSETEANFDDTGILIIYSMCRLTQSSSNTFDLGLFEYQGAFPLSGTGAIKEFVVAGKLVTTTRTIPVSGILYDLVLDASLPEAIHVDSVSFCPVFEYDSALEAREFVGSICDALSGTSAMFTSMVLQAAVSEFSPTSLERSSVAVFDEPDDDACLADYHETITSVEAKYSEIKSRFSVHTKTKFVSQIHNMKWRVHQV